MVEDGLPDKARDQLAGFADRGPGPGGSPMRGPAWRRAGRLNCANVRLASFAEAASAITARQTRLVGGLQYDLVAGRTTEAAAALRALAPTYDELADALGAFASRQ